MWIRQCELDARAESSLPIPARIASNEEFIPPLQSPAQKEYESRALALSEQAAKRHGLSRREFLRTGSGMAAALLAMNQVYGPCYEVDAAEVEDQKAFEEKWPKDQFIFDIQTHHVDVAHKWYDDTRQGKATVSFFRMLRPRLTVEESLEALNRAHPAAPPTRWWPRANTSTTSPAANACSPTACCAPISAKENSTRWSGRSSS